MHDDAAWAPAPPAPGRRGAPVDAGPGAPEGHGPAVSVRGGHPEHREPGGGWGLPPEPGAGGVTPEPPVRPAGGRRRISGPRQEFVEAFDDGVYGRPVGLGEAAGDGPGTVGGETVRLDAEGDERGVRDGDGPEDGPGDDESAPGDRRRQGLGRSFTGVAAAALTTVLAIVVAGQVADPRKIEKDLPSAQEIMGKNGREASRSDDRPAAEASKGPRTFAEKLDTVHPFAPDLRGDGTFRTVGGHDKGSGEGKLIRYRVDVEGGLPLDAELFAEAVTRTLNDDRSWGHGGMRSFERVSSGETDFVVTLASPATTAQWCSRSGLDTTVDNVSCDSASTRRVMINAYRWAQGAETFEGQIGPYRQMLINHEVGHRLGFNHRSCPEQGAPAPVMMQQTKFLTMNGVTCKPNAWPYPGS